MSDSLARRIARFALALSWDDISPARRRKLKWCLVDFLACCAGGARVPEGESAFVLARPGPIHVPGTTRSLTPETAAIAIGTLGALLQYHDGYGRGGNHPSSSVVSAAWVSWDPGRPLRELLTAIAAGYETANRLAGFCHPRQSKAGSAPTATMGAIGAAVARGRLAGLDEARMTAAIANAAFYAPLAAYEGLRNHGSAVPLHGGIAARAGLEAVTLAQAGLYAGEHMLEGQGGPGFLDFLHGGGDLPDPATWRCQTLDAVYFKPLPGCRHTHPGLEAVLKLLREGPIAVDRIRAIRLSSYALALTFATPPRSAHELYDRLMSYHWVLGSALAHGRYGLDNVLRPAVDPAIAALYPRMEFTLDPGLEASYPRALSARVEIAMEDGARSASEIAIGYGEPREEGPYSPGGGVVKALDDAGMAEKFDELIREAPDAEALRRLRAAALEN